LHTEDMVMTDRCLAVISTILLTPCKPLLPGTHKKYCSHIAAQITTLQTLPALSQKHTGPYQWTQPKWCYLSIVSAAQQPTVS